MLTPELLRIADGIATDFFLPGYDRDDVRQEARIAAWVACCDYDQTLGVSFHAFARLVIRRRLIDAVKVARAGKHRPLNDSARVGRDEEGQETTIVELLDGDQPSLTQIVADRETLADFRRTVRYLLTPMEREALRGYLNGVRYTTDRVKDKPYDNALQRARQKLAKAAG